MVTCPVTDSLEIIQVFIRKIISFNTGYSYVFISFMAIISTVPGTPPALE